MHFDKFYSVKLDNNIIIDDIIEDMKSPLDFYSKYGYEIYCPDCKKAKLKYSSPSDRGNRKSFISAIRIEEHGEHCNYKHKYISYSEAREIADTKVCVNTLKRIVDRMLVINNSRINNDEDDTDDTVVVEEVQSNNTTKKRKIFKKSINKISLDDKDCYYYYGKTKLCFINDYYKNVIQVKINNKKSHFFNINLRKKINLDLQAEKIYCISFFANVSAKKYKDVDYPEINLLNNDCIYIKEYNE